MGGLDAQGIHFFAYEIFFIVNWLFNVLLILWQCATEK